MKRITVLLCLSIFLIAWTAAPAQEYRGNLFVTVVTEDGQPIAGATADLKGRNSTRSGESDASGKIRFSRIEPGTYDLQVEKDGFNIKVVQSIQVLTGQTVETVAILERSEIIETVVVTSEAPLLDRRNMGTRTVVSPAEVSQIPTARDPWAVLSTIPGLQTDRVNVGGNQSGQQSRWAGKGDDRTNATWVMDGVELTDIASQGGSATYFDFNSFQEIGFTTGGGGFEQQTAGQQLSFVTKQGANRITGSLGLLLADGDWQSDPATYYQPTGAEVQSNEIRETFEKHFDLGGPIKKDMAWYWFGFNHNDVQLLLPGPGESQLQDNTKLQNYTVKVNGTATAKGNWKVFYTNGDKQKFGRNAGPTRPQETTWRQQGPSPITSIDFSWFFTPNLELQFQYGHVAGGFELYPLGDANAIRWDAGFVWRDTFTTAINDRPTDSFAIRGNWFADTGSLSHEVKFGVKYKYGEARVTILWGLENAMAVEWATGPPVDPDDPDSPPQWTGEAWLFRQMDMQNGMTYRSAWAGDTMLLGNWTFNVGALLVSQTGEQLPSVAPANQVCPTCLPAIEFEGFDPGFEWLDLLPRLGVTYTFPTVRRQMVRLGLARYADQLGQGDVAYSHPLGETEIDYPWNDVNGNHLFDPGEIDFDNPLRGNVDLDDPGSAESTDVIRTDLEAPRVDELILGYEIEVVKDLNLGVNATWRRRERELWTPIVDLTTVPGGEDGFGQNTEAYQPLDGSYWEEGISQSGTVACGAEDGPCELPGQGTPYSVQAYLLNAEGAARTNGARSSMLANRPGYEEYFVGLELTAVKRLSRRWMLRGYVAWNDWTKNVSDVAVQNPANLQGDTTKDGSIVVAGGSAGSGAFSEVWFGTATWQYNVNGLYQLPANFTVSWNINGREGYTLPYFHRIDQYDADDRLSRQNLQVRDADSSRYSDLHVLDLAVSYLVKLPGNTALDLRVEGFNLLNADTILQLDSRQAASSSGTIEEVLSPRVLRLGARVTF